MDPNAALKRLRVLATLASEEKSDSWRVAYLFDFVEQFESLDEWLSRGGFLPDDWRKMRGPTFPGEVVE